ncbi:MAG: phosphotransferase system enzyme I (PtsP) [Planctomycetota bacterium]
MAHQQKKSIHGIAVAPGLAMAPVHVIRAAPEVVPTWSLREDEVESEFIRLTGAIEAVSLGLEYQRQKLLEAGTSEKEAEIFSVHRMILADPSALKKVRERIAQERLNAESCIRHLITALEASMSNLEGNSVRNYGADLSEPWRIVLQELMSSEREAFVSGGESVVLAAAQLTPHVVTYLDRDRVRAVITETGGRFSHGAVLARSFGIPCVVGVPNLLSRLEQGMRVIVDGEAGTVQLSPDQDDIDHFLERHSRRMARMEVLEAEAALPAETSDGHSFRVKANIESIRDLDMKGFDVSHTDGVGLLRTEFLYMERTQFPSEEEQYRLYRRVVEAFGGLPVTIRTLDIGGDKQLPYFTTPHEENPALGWRGIRVSLEWQDLLRVQLRAALRASEHGPVRILLPMVTSHEEVVKVHTIFNHVRAQLIEQGYALRADIPVGIMIEVPSALLSLPRILQEVDFVSVGTNDLVQYLLACDRDNPWVSKLYDPYHPAVIWALNFVAVSCAAAGKSCTVCGEMAGDYATATMLLGMGYRGVSVSNHFVSQVKYAVRGTSLSAAQALATEIVQMDSGAKIRDRLERSRVSLHGRLGSQT